MTEYEEFLMSKVNDLERKMFELDKRVKALEDPAKSGAAEPRTGEASAPSAREKDTTRYLLDGQRYKKSRLILAAVNKFVSEHRGVSAEELEKAFPSREFKIVTFKCVTRSDSIPEKYKDKDKVARYFVDDPIRLEDGTEMMVCNQWNATMTELFVAYVNKNYGYGIVADR